MQAIILLILLFIILIYAPPFNLKFKINNKEVIIETSEIQSSESSE
ncbi:hypothetical protein [Acidianus bottle-shaped virus 3 strain ABV3]|uniref:Uncharacterized protein n=1 Tax=Acidianus bottle-shaped virus 3 strain ABV3 TaxID=1732174 RepID=A0A0N9NY29_9VIRU|nr:hypothetical protein AVU00_gp64 [Acidianus bottle-shaped virus 3 strain ABV3]ALG96866.1 hypothetical protein [Acidianus bottle-shaped virus 3 strain ABV3]